MFIDQTTLPQVTGRSVEEALVHFTGLRLTGRRGAIAEKILKEIRARLRFLVDVGLNYLTLDRSAETLSGGEAQRIRLASQIGAGLLKVEMRFLPDIYVPCDVCKGKRYNRESLDVRYKHNNIHQVLDMTVEEARDFFDAVPVLARKLQTLVDVGLSYIKLGQSATTLSGGEAQRVKLSRELSKRDTGKTLYILDEPTTGLHFHDIAQLLEVLHRLRDHGNTVVVIEHNLDVIKTADWVVDLGPEGGSGGGQIVGAGTPEQLAQNQDSHTGQFLKPVLGAKPRRVA